MYHKETQSIHISVEPVYLEDQSMPENSVYVWAYHIEIENRGGETVQLKNRHWYITDALGNTQEVHGAGVVGEQPVLKPGERFAYTSGTPLSTPSGIMLGSYEMAVDGGPSFMADIPAFSLDSPYENIELQ